MNTEATNTAREIQRMFGSNYYAATLLLPKAIRDDIFIFYAFVRLADEIVDNATDENSASEELAFFSAAWKKMYHTGEGTDTILRAFRRVCLQHDIAYTETTDFLSAMQTDLVIKRYDTYSDLQAYMYGSAEIIGVMLTKVFGCQDEAALPYAQALGEAMQLTNFLRDIREDYIDRGRVYLPQDLLHKHSVKEGDLLKDPSTPEVRSLLEELCGKAESLYTYAQQGITLLPRNVQPAVRTASALYREIVRELARQQYNISDKKIRFSKLKKTYIALLYGYVKTN